MKLADFFVQIGFDADTPKVKDFARAVGEIPLAAAAAFTALALIGREIKQLANEAMTAAVGFEAFETQTGLSAQQLQRWQHVAVQANVSAETMTSSITALQKQLAEIRMGRGNIQPFALLGIDPRGNAFTVMEQLRKKIGKVDRTTATNLIGQMGLSPDMMNVLSLSAGKFEQFGNRVRNMSERDEKAFLRSKLALNQFGLEFKAFGFEHLAPLAEMFANLTDSIGGLKNALPALGAAAAAVGLAFAPMTAGIAALLLLLDDFLAYKQGRDSMMGSALGGMKKFGSMPQEKADEKAAAFGSAMADKVLDSLGIPRGQTIPGFLWDKVKGGGETNIEIRVDGAASPQETAEVIEGHLKRTIGRAGTQTSGKQDRR